MENTSQKKKFIKGMDVSTLLEVERLGGKFYDKDGEERDLLSVLQEYGANAVRLRLWNNPHSRQDGPYGAGNNDLETTLALAKRAHARGMGVLLDLHYSDFWADPDRQVKPKAWADFTGRRLEYAVYDHTLAILRKFQEEDVLPEIVQVGNELVNGLLWPDGKTPNFENIAAFVNAGIHAVRTMDKGIPVMLHLGGRPDARAYREWFDDYFANDGEDFEIIGMSYCPLNGPLSGLARSMRELAAHYGKEIVLAEVSAGFTSEDYASYEKLDPAERKGMAAKPALAKKLEYPMTKKGQADFMRALMQEVARVPDGLGRGFFYWEPGWLPVPGSGWATKASLKYLGDPGPCGNRWANQALFDYDGKPLPALDAIQEF